MSDGKKRPPQIREDFEKGGDVGHKPPTVSPNPPSIPPRTKPAAVPSGESPPTPKPKE